MSDGNDEMYFDDWVDLGDDETDEETTVESAQHEPTLDDFLPNDCIVVTTDGTSLEPQISVKGRYQNLGDAQAFLRYALAKIQYIKHVQDRS